MIRSSRLYIHHVGLEGADADFPKTVYRQVEIDLICDVLLSEARDVMLISSSLSHLFPSGRCHCWGVPELARSVIRHLAQGDYVLLIRTTREGGEIPALCWVKFVLPFSSPALSAALWQKDRYARIFFFDTERIDLTWEEFCHHVGYARYDPRGRFLAVSDDKLACYGGAKGYISYLRRLRSEGTLRLPVQEGTGEVAVHEPASHFSFHPPFATPQPHEEPNTTPSPKALTAGSWPGDRKYRGDEVGDLIRREGRTA